MIEFALIWAPSPILLLIMQQFGPIVTLFTIVTVPSKIQLISIKLSQYLLISNFNLYSNLFPHCGLQDNESTSTFYRRKSLILGHMTRMVMDIDLGIKDSSDRDHFRFKRLSASGELCFQELDLYNKYFD